MVAVHSKQTVFKNLFALLLVKRHMLALSSAPSRQHPRSLLAPVHLYLSMIPSAFVPPRSLDELMAMPSDTPFRRGLTRSRSAPASINMQAASPCPDSIARCSGVLPARSCPLRRVLGLPSGGLRRICNIATEPVVAALWRGNWDALSLALIYPYLPISSCVEGGRQKLTSAPFAMRRRPI